MSGDTGTPPMRNQANLACGAAIQWFGPALT